jgi:hypothetical protein
LLKKFICVNYKTILFLLAIGVVHPAWAWGNIGHRLIAAIAYNALTPNARQQIDFYTEIVDPNYPPLQRFLYLSNRLDQLRDQTHRYDSWHYINIPFSEDGSVLLPIKPENVVWAIQTQEQILNNAELSKQQRAEALVFLIHLIGDIHQPLHCADRYSLDFPQGDEGGVKILIEKDGAHNLHEWWDRGGSLFKHREKIATMTQINRQALQWMKAYPQDFFGTKIADLDLNHWAQDCFLLARHVAYVRNLEQFYSADYRKMAEDTIKKQIVLAGYRLAFILNAQFDKDVSHEKTRISSGSRQSW